MKRNKGVNFNKDEKYKTLSAWQPRDLDELVVEHLNAGYELYGKPYVLTQSVDVIRAGTHHQHKNRHYQTVILAS